jgi:hypothetical protein
MKKDSFARVQTICGQLGVAENEVDLFVDLGEPNFEPYDTFSIALVAALRRLGDLNRFRNFVLLATAIPETFKDVAKGQEELPRHDWLFFKTLRSKLPSGMRRRICAKLSLPAKLFTPQLSPGGYAKAARFAVMRCRCTNTVQPSLNQAFSKEITIATATTTLENVLSKKLHPATLRDGKM